MYPQKKKSSSGRQGNEVAKNWAPSTNPLPSNFRSMMSDRITVLKCGGAYSCWNGMSLGTSSTKIDTRKSCR